MAKAKFASLTLYYYIKHREWEIDHIIPLAKGGEHCVKRELAKAKFASLTLYYYIKHREWEIDHIIPLAKGGEHCVKNLQPLWKTENRQKGAQIL